MYKLLIRVLFTFLVSTCAATVSANPKETCTFIVSYLGYPVNDYRFEESGFFSMEKHHFGTLTCYIDIHDEFDSVYRGQVPLAEDGYFGVEALAERDRLISEFNAGVATARDLQSAEIEAARKKFRQTENVLTQERDDALEALRASSQPSPTVQDSADTALNAAVGTDGATESTNESTGTPREQSSRLEIDSEAEMSRMFVVVDRLTRRTCPSTACGAVGTLMYREAVEVLEERQGWGRITQPYRASCINGISEYIDSGNARCEAENGIVDGKFAEWVSLDYLENERLPDPADTAAADEALVAQSDDFRLYRTPFAKAARELIEQGRCSESDFLEWGGWMSSPSKGNGVYFMYCGGAHVDNRLYLDVRTGEVFQ